MSEASTTPEPTETMADLIARSGRDGGRRILQVTDGWLQGRSVYGGVQMALAVQTGRDHLSADLPIRSLHATFVGPVASDQAMVASAEVLRAGRSVTHVQSAIHQAGDLCLEVTILFGASRKAAVRFDASDPIDLDPAQGRPLPFIPGVVPNFIQHYEVRWLKGQPPFTGAETPDATIIARPRAEAPYTEADVLALTDVIPSPAICIMRDRVPASSMNCALELIRPEAVYGTRQWVRFEVELHDAHSGYAWQTARLYAESGTLLAIAHQSVAIFG